MTEAEAREAVLAVLNHADEMDQSKLVEAIVKAVYDPIWECGYADGEAEAEQMKD